MSVPAPSDFVTIVISWFTKMYENNYVLYATVLIIGICLFYLFRG